MSKMDKAFGLKESFAKRTSKGNFSYRSFRGSISDNTPPPKLVSDSSDAENVSNKPSSLLLVSQKGKADQNLNRSEQRLELSNNLGKCKKKLSFLSKETYHSDDTIHSETTFKSTQNIGNVESFTDVESSLSDDDDDISTETETEIQEKIMDPLGKVKIVTRKVKKFERSPMKKSKALEKKISCGTEVSEASDEYEEIEEEVEEEIEVEEEEENEEDEEEDEEERSKEEERREEEERSEGEDRSEEEKRSEEETEAFEENIETEEEGEIPLSHSFLEEVEKSKGSKEEILTGEEELWGIEFEGEEEEEIEEGDQYEGEITERYEDKLGDTTKELEVKEMVEGEDLKQRVNDIKPKRKMKKIKIIKKVKKKVRKDGKLKKSSSPIKEDILKNISSGLLEGERRVDSTDLSTFDHIRDEKDVTDTEHYKLVDIVRSKIGELVISRKKNKILQKTVVDYSKQKRAEYIYQGETVTGETVHRYHKKLKILDEILNATNTEKQRMTAEITAMKETLLQGENNYEKEVAELLQIETDLGKVVHDSKTGNQLDGVTVNHLVQRHKIVLKQLSEVRLKHIKLFNHFTTREKILKSLDCLEGNLNLMDYEQLRVDNQFFAEKIEEREEELSRLRRKMLAAVHTYAHVLEKSDTVLESIERGRSNLVNVDTKITVVRENVNKLKQYRDGLRVGTRKMKKNAGLLTQPNLALDYENSLSKIQQGKIKLEKIIKRFNIQRSKIFELRKEIQMSTTIW